MQHAGAAQRVDLGLVAAECLRHDDRILLDPSRVAMRVGIPGLDGRCQGLDRHQVGVLELRHRRAQRGAFLFQAARHLVEGVGELANLVMGRHQRLMVEVAGADQPGRLHQAVHRSGDAARQPDADREREQHAGQEERDQDDAQLVGVGQ